jgi:hypothetical protein
MKTIIIPINGGSYKSDYKIIKLLGEGFFGKVYLVSKNKKKYAMKIEYISSEKDRYLQNELLFVKKVASKNPTHFIQLIEHNFITNCAEKLSKLPSWIDNEGIKYMKQLRGSKICVRKIYSLVDTSLSELNLNELTLSQKYSMLIQVLFIVYLFEKNGFVHGDYHFGNIGVINADKKLDILGHKIPTLGYLYQAIDYGDILYEKTISDKKFKHHNETEKKHYDDHYLLDKVGIIEKMINSTKFWDYVKKNQIDMKGYDIDVEAINSAKEAKTLHCYTTNKHIVFRLFMIYFTKKFQQIVLRDSFTEKIDLDFHIPIEDIIFGFVNILNIESVINYFIVKLNGLIEV